MRTTMAPPHDRKKRQWNANERNHYSTQQHQHAQVADDLAIAATYAAQIAGPTTGSMSALGTSHVASLAHNTGSDDAPLSTAHAAAAAAAEDGDDNEISLEEGCSSDASLPDATQMLPLSSGDAALNEPEVEQTDAQESAGVSIMNSQVVNDSDVATSLNDHNDKDDADDESDVDLAEAVARMDQDDDEDEGGGGGEGGSGGAPPKTANEVDAYHVTVKQLEKVLGTSLSTKEWEEMHVKAKAAKLNQAGHVHYHLVEDRTIVVQSKEGVLLEEGNILVIKKVSTSSPSSSSSLEIDEGWVPMGKIFEVFGPVSRPFYSVRLPDPPERKSPPPVRNMPKEASVETVDVASSSDPSCATLSSDEAARLESEDPWAPNGKYTQIFRSTPKTLIYYLIDEATLINTHAVYQASGRGCDASNMHDEEVLNPKDMYYSDDDEEREATGKQRGRKQRAAGSGNINNPHAEQPNFIPTTYPNRSFGGGGGGGGGGRGFARPHHPGHTSQHVPGFHTNYPAMGTNVVSGFVQQPSYPMTASTTINMNLAPMFNGRGNATIGQVVSTSFITNHSNARHAAGSVPPPGQQPGPQPPAEDTVYYDYS